jgi:hypothetical protein
MGMKLEVVGNKEGQMKTKNTLNQDTWFSDGEMNKGHVEYGAETMTSLLRCSSDVENLPLLYDHYFI